MSAHPISTLPELATDAVGNVDLDELVWRLNELLVAPQPDLAVLHDLIDQILKHGVVLGMLARTTRHLKAIQLHCPPCTWPGRSRGESPPDKTKP